jgi:hypothetical protein
MWACPDCRAPLGATLTSCACGWAPAACEGYDDCRSTRDRRSSEVASYTETYDLLAERNLVDPTLSNSYVATLARQFADGIGELAGKDFCDVGAGRGYLIREAVGRGARSAMPVDIAAPALASIHASTGIRGVLANAEALPFERQFDVLTATDVVEHVLNVANFLVCANWALRDGGLLAVRVPFREKMFGYSNYFGLPMAYTHLRTFNTQTLVDLVEPFGFKAFGRARFAGFFAQRSHPIFDRWPKLRNNIRGRLRRSFAGDDVSTINPTLGRLLMRPVEIGMVFRKQEHMQTRNIHAPLQEFARTWRRGSAPTADSARRAPSA